MVKNNTRCYLFFFLVYNFVKCKLLPKYFFTCFGAWFDKINQSQIFSSYTKKITTQKKIVY